MEGLDEAAWFAAVDSVAFPLTVGGHATYDLPALIAPQPESIAFVIMWGGDRDLGAPATRP